MFFAKPGDYAPCKMFSIGHLILFSITIVAIIIVFKFTKNKDKETIKKIIKRATLLLWTLEIIKIIFNFAVGNGKNPNNYIPLYYCSLILYAGALSSFGRGKLKRVGDVFLATGSIIGGIFFMVCPNTSLTMYPMFHYISIQSFIFHGTMVYLGMLVGYSNYIDLKLNDIKYYATLIIIISGISYIVNKFLNTNFMFISKNFPGTPIELIYNATGKFFTILMIIIQAIGPFYVIYLISNIIKKYFAKKQKENNEIKKEEITV